MSPVGAIFVPFPPKTGKNMLHPRPLPIVQRMRNRWFFAILEIMTTDEDLSQWNCYDGLQLVVSLFFVRRNQIIIDSVLIHKVK